MPGDFSRKTFRQEQHYSGVLEQQGRVQTDADWNEQLDIQLYRTETGATDVIGQSGVPKKNDGFKIGRTNDGHDLTIAPGRIYVEGLLCELDEPATYTAQPYLPHPEFTTPASSPPHDSLSLASGNYLVFLDAWQREITALDDKLIREVALGGPDTTTRLQNVWQVKLMKVGETSPPSSPPADCKTPFAQFDQYTLASTGTLNARAEPVDPGNNPCVLPPQAGYNRLENQLYRVEIHTGGSLNEATFKWSRDNSSVETTIKDISGSLLKVADTGKDEVLNFAGGQWVEIVHDESTLKGKPNALVQIDKIGPGPNEITLKTTVDQFKNLPGLKLRRWDQDANATSSGISAALSDVALDKWIKLEDGVQVQFSAGDYHAGDYWLIPARTATGEIEWPPYEIPNKNPIAQSPRGIRHHYCRLALIQSTGSAINVEPVDCRKPFPALTEICAEDICFDNDKCDFAGAETVQDALDRLCAARDLRFHNKHLHGWGIVCGLQVECGPDASGDKRHHVTVRPGYAIDCDGNDINLDKEEPIDLIARIKQALPPGSPPGSVKDGEVCLVLEGRDKDARFRVEAYKPPKKNWETLLAGTLLADVIQDCVLSLIDFIKAEFTVPASEEKGLVGPAQKRITTFSNLLIQLINKQNGSRVFLSGEKGQSGKNLEDTILRNFYNKLREKLQSHTFCAMFEGARPFPAYPAEYSGKGLTTIFGKGFQTRLRVAPDSRTAYAVGAGNKINVYDLSEGEMVAEVEFPGGTSAIVQDVAFSKNGKQLYAVATLKNKDSMFASATVSGTKYTWGQPTVICEVLFLSLGTSPDSEKVYATGKNKGLYEIDPANVNATPSPIYPFNATGHLVVASQGAFATFSESTIESDKGLYDRVKQLSVKTIDPHPPEYPLGVTGGVRQLGQDDIALDGVDVGKLYVVTNPPPGLATKHLTVFNLSTPGTPLKVVDLKENTAIRVEYNPVSKHAMVTYEDSYRIGLIDSTEKLVPEYQHPVQISPRSIVITPDRKRVGVLNLGSNTLNVIPAERLDPKNQIPLKPLVDYRADVINAFADLLGGLLQYLKDCFCDHFLINCPTCDPDDKLYLACITIKNEQVYKVCNFSLRKYVHSFPTVEYWLSVIPILPLIKKAVETFCCAALPGFFGKYSAFKPETTEGAITPATNVLKGEHIYKGVTFAQQTDFRGAVAKGMTLSAPGKTLLTDVVKNTAKRAMVTREGAVKPTDLANKPADEARKNLENAKITVEKVEPYDPNKAGHNLIRYAGTPQQLEAGMRVNLVTKDDKVLFYTLAEEPSISTAELRGQVEAGLATVAQSKDALDKALPVIEGLRNDVLANKATVAENKAALEKISPKVEELRAKVEADTFASKAVLDKISPQLQNLQSKVEADSALLAANKAIIDQALPQLKTLNAAVEANRAALDKSSPQIAELRARLDATTTAIAESKAAVADAAGLREQVNSLRTELLSVRQTHLQELAARDKDIAELKLDLNNSVKVIGTINERIKKLPPV